MKKSTLIFLFVLVSSLSFGQIFITELADPNNSSYSRYVEIYNAGDSDVDLQSEGYGLWRYTNGNDYSQSTIHYLTGTIGAKQCYIIARDSTFFNASYGFYPNQDLGDGGPADSNGDDQILLVQDNGTDTVVVDIFGVIAEDGTGTCHEFEDGRAERIASVTTGNSGTWDGANWNVWADSQVDGCTSHIKLAVDTDDGIFDPGIWIGCPTTYVCFDNFKMSASEDGVSVDVCVKIYAPDATTATTVEIAFDESSTVTNGSDFTNISFPYTLTFPAGSSGSQCLSLTITDDTDPELDEIAVLKLQNPAGGASAALGGAIDYSLKIQDNDLASLPEGDIIITEIMQNPKSVADAMGEWFEIYNTTSSDIDLFGVKFSEPEDETEVIQVTSSLIIPAGEYFVFANNGNSEENGNLPTPDYVYDYTALFISNGSDGLAITKAGVGVDTVLWDNGATFPDPNGSSMSLKVAFLNSVDNDNGANWEKATYVYGDGDKGTPGFANDGVSCNTVISTSETTDVLLCKDSLEGVVTVTATGFTTTLTYTLIPGDISNETGVFDKLVAGTYTVSVTDANNCTPVVTGDLVISEPVVISIDSEVSTDETAAGASDGTITITATGGTGALAYTLSPGDVTNATGVFDGLAPDTYTVSVTDANTCGPVVSSDITVGAGVSVHDAEADGFTVYPNPVIDGVLSIEFSTKGKKDISIYNLLGKKVFECTDFNDESIDLSAMGSGIYILKLDTKESSSSAKIIIQ